MKKVYIPLILLAAIFLTDSLTAQNVGIGEVAPSTKLEIKGDGSDLLNVKDNSDISKFFIDSDGKVGIGISTVGVTPNSHGQTSIPNLHILNSSDMAGVGEMLRLERYNNGQDIGSDASGSIGLYINDNNVGGGEVARISWKDGQSGNSDPEGTGELHFWTSETEGESVPVQRMTINKFGDIGIGTTTPQAQLHTTGDIRFANYSNGYLQVDGNGDVSTIATIPSGSIDEDDPTWDGDANTTGDIGRSGSVGIGTVSPSEKLDVNGNIEVNDLLIDANQDWSIGGSGENLEIRETEDGNKLWAEFIDDQALHLSGTPNLYADGNIGIGTTTPSVPLEINKAITGAGTLFKLSKSESDISASSQIYMDFEFTDGNANGTPQARIGAQANTDLSLGGGTEAEGTADLIFYTAAAAGPSTNNLAERMRIKATGELQYANYSNGYLQVDGSGNMSAVSTIPSGSITEADPTWSGSANTTASVGRTGNVGIGVAVPTDKLDVTGNIAFTGGMKSRGANYTSTWMTFDEDQYGNSTIIGAGGLTAIGAGESAGQIRANVAAGSEVLHLASDNGMQFYTSLQSGWASRVNAMEISSAGDVAIGGGTSSSYKLRVYGKVRSDGINETSDGRLKKNVKSVVNALDKVMALRGVNYEWRTEEYPEKKFSNGVELGVIAQEVEKILPEVVDMDDEGYRSVQYSHIVPVLIEAIKEQQYLIQEKENKMQAMQSQLSDKDCEIQDLRKDFGQMKAEMSEIKSLLQMSAQK